MPARENFSDAAAGAISLVVRRFCAVTPQVVVLGTRRDATFGGIPYVGVRGGLSVWLALRQVRPAVLEVHQQARMAVVLALLFPRVRVLLWLHNDPVTMRGLRTSLGRWLAVRVLHRVVCVSEFLAARFGAGAVVLPNPFDVAELPAVADREQIILFVGRMTEGKGPDLFLAACALALPRLPGWRAAMIGGDRFGPESPETAFVVKMRGRAAEIGVDFGGPQPHAAVMAAMSRAAIMVVPSRWAEPFGLTALEAMAAGTALITTGAGGLREVAGEAAVYVPPEPSAIAEEMVALAGDALRRAELAAAGRARATDFGMAAIAPQLQALRAV